MAATKTTMEGLVTRYRREVGQSATANVELEIRLQNVEYDAFAAIHAQLVARAHSEQKGSIKVRASSLSHVVSAIMEANASKTAGALRASQIRETTFGAEKKTQFVIKRQLIAPWRAQAGHPYIVSISTEAPSESFITDNSALIRVKTRASYEIEVSGPSDVNFVWRVDATVRRQLASSGVGSLKTITGQMFVGNSPDNLLTDLRLSDAAQRSLYKFELEIEFLGPRDMRDLIRPGDITAAADAVLGLISPDYAAAASRQNEIYRVAQHILPPSAFLQRFSQDLGLKRLLPQALALTRTEYRKVFPPSGWQVLPKTDGERAIVGVRDGAAVILGSDFRLIAGGAAGGDTYLDAEITERDDPRGPLCYVFDAIVISGDAVAEEGYERRSTRLEEGAAILRKAGLRAVGKTVTTIPAGAATADLANIFRGILEGKHEYAIDGIIMVEPGKPYAETVTLKYKETKDNTIDFLARRAPPTVLGTLPFIDAPGHKLYFLFCGVDSKLGWTLGLQRCPGYSTLFPAGGTYAPIQFSPSDAPLAYLYQHPDGAPAVDGAIVEMRCRGGCAAAGGGAALADWELVRQRGDRAGDLAAGKYFGNDYYTAEMIWLNYLDPFPASQLWLGPGLDYFQRDKDGIYFAQTAATSFMKSRRIATLAHFDWVVDIGAGKGQDLGRYLDAQIGHLIAIDRDRAALSELIRRKFSFARKREGVPRGGCTASADERRGRPAAAISAAITAALASRPGARPGPRPGAHPAAAITAPPVQISKPSERPSKTKAMLLHVLAADATQPFETTFESIHRTGLQRGSADAVVCNLAVHYFCASIASIRNFIALARSIVKVGGVVILTVMIGEAVHAVLNGVAEGGTWDVFETPRVSVGGIDASDAPQVRKYSIRRGYSSDELEAAGQKIGVLLPFSDGEYYEEYLTNTRVFADEFSAQGFTLVESGSVAESLSDFELRNGRVASQLTAGDKQYLSLYGELVFRRHRA